MSSVLGNNCESLEHLTSTVYQISRALVAFEVAEVIVLNDSPKAIVIASLLQYFITPPYLISETFKGVDLPDNVFSRAKKYQSIPNLPAFESDKFKEGISITKKPSNWSKTHPEFQAKSANGRVKPLPKGAKVTKFVQIGREKCIELKDDVELNRRLTIDLANGTVTTPNKAYGKNNVLGVYGYEVRLANKLIDVWTDTKIQGGYTSSGFVPGGEFHSAVDSTLKEERKKTEDGNLLVVVGQWGKFDKLLEECGLDGVKLGELFDFKVTVPKQLRIEDALMIGLGRVTV